jgi:D-3-phosphoglycerate dehydrogenase
VRVLFADASEPSTLTALESRGHECVLRPDLTADGLPGEVRGVDVLVVRSTRVTAQTITAADRLALVIRAGAGTNTIDCDAAAERGVFVANVPGRNSIAVAELVMGLLLAIDRRIADNVADLRAGRWDKKQYGKADGLYGSTMAIVGLGEIGLTVAERARAFGLDVRALAKDGRDPRRAARADDLGVTMVESLQELVDGADIVSLHVPAGPDTTGLVDRTFLSWMRPGAILLNTSRGDVVDEEALLEALDSRGLRAGLDVYADEPSSGTAQWTSRLAQHPQVVGTHHIGASTRQAQRAIAEGVVEIVDAFVEGLPDFREPGSTTCRTFV